jgi:hypothetical protein
MARSKRANRGYREHHAALVPLRFDFGPPGTGNLGSDVVVKAERPVLMQYSDDEAEQWRFLEALLDLSWLPAKVRYAVMEALGRSLQKEKVGIERARTQTLKQMVSEVEARMRANGERPPRGGFYVAAVEEVAENAGLEPEALERRIERLNAKADTI